MSKPIVKRAKRKRDRRTVVRIARMRTTRATEATKAASLSQGRKRLEYLPMLCEMRAAGLSLHDMAREFKRRGIKTMRGKRIWEAKTIKNMLDYYEPFFRWRDGASMLRPEDWATYFREVQKLLGGKLLKDYYEAAHRHGTSLLRALPAVPPAQKDSGVTEMHLRLNKYRRLKRTPPDGPAKSEPEVQRYDIQRDAERG